VQSSNYAKSRRSRPARATRTAVFGVWPVARAAMSRAVSSLRSPAGPHTRHLRVRSPVVHATSTWRQGAGRTATKERAPLRLRPESTVSGATASCVFLSRNARGLLAALPFGVALSMSCGGSVDLRSGPSEMDASPLISADALAHSPKRDGHSSADPVPPINHVTDADLECTDDSECELVAVTCCGACEQDLTALNTRAAARRRAECAGVACAPCAAVTPSSFVADCSVIGLCGFVRLDYLPGATDCRSDADCHVRTRSCCECGGSTAPGDLFGVSDDAAFKTWICNGSEVCGTCSPAYPAEVHSLCSRGFCLIADPRPR
jgi:hypothetical protein